MKTIWRGKYYRLRVSRDATSLRIFRRYYGVEGLMKTKTTPLWLHQHGAEVIDIVNQLDTLAKQGFVVKAHQTCYWKVTLRGPGIVSEVYKGKYTNADTFVNDLKALVATDPSQSIPPGLSAKDVINQLRNIEATNTRVIAIEPPER